MDSETEPAEQYRFLTIFASEEKVAAAFYSVETNQISVMSQMAEPGTGFEVTQQILRQIEPTITVIASSASADFVTAIRNLTDREDFVLLTPKHITDLMDTEQTVISESDQPVDEFERIKKSLQEWTPTIDGQKQEPARKRQRKQTVLNRVSCNVVSLAAKFFSYEQAKNTILEYDGFKVPVDANRVEKHTLIAGIIDMEETVTVRALAGLLTYLTKSAICQMVQMDEQSVRYFRLQDSVRISDVALRNLAVVSTELVPRREKMAPAQKQGLSLFSLMQVHCRSQLAKKKLRQLLVQPIRDQNELNQRLDFIEHFIRPEAEERIAPDSLLIRRLKMVQSLNPVFRAMRCKLVGISEWRSFQKSFTAAIRSLEAMIEYREPVQMAGRAAELLTPGIQYLNKQMEAVIDFAAEQARQPDEQLPVNRGFELKEGNLPEYDEYRYMQRNMDDYLRQATLKEADQWRCNGLPVPQFTITYMYGPGFLLKLSLYTNALTTVMNKLDEWGADRVFVATTIDASHVYYKTTHLKAYDLSVGDKVMKIPSILCKVQREMQNLVLIHTDEITDMIEHCASVEALLSFALIAKQESWVRPTFSSTDEIDIREGRHPLYQKKLGANNFVANSFVSPSRGRKVKIITGPNNSGKTVYMKQTALLVHMALCGSFVPAESAVVPIVDSIFTCMTHNFSITKETSSFFSDLKAMGKMMGQSTGKSLLIVDEFGKGTRPQDGIALLAAAIKQFVAKDTPHVLIACHFHSLHKLLKEEDRKIQYLRFRPDVDSSGIHMPDYRIEEGRAGTSLASSVYAKIGLEKEVMDRAQEVYQQLISRQPLTPRYDAAQKEAKENLELIGKLFLQANLSSRAGIEDLFEKISAIHF